MAAVLDTVQAPVQATQGPQQGPGAPMSYPSPTPAVRPTQQPLWDVAAARMAEMPAADLAGLPVDGPNLAKGQIVAK